MGLGFKLGLVSIFHYPVRFPVLVYHPFQRAFNFFLFVFKLR